MKKIWLVLVLCSLSFGLAFAQQLEVTVIYVGQGDSIFIKAPNGLKILIDAGGGSLGGGNAYDNISAILAQNGISPASPLDYLILTHYHSDHYDYVDNVIRDFGLPKIAVIDRGGSKKYDGTSLADIPTAYLDAVAPKRNVTGVLTPGARIELGNGAHLLLLAVGYADEGSAVKKIKVLDMPDVEAGSELENAKSMAFVLRWNGFDMLLGGDTNEKVEPSIGETLRRRGINIDVFKVHHHGSATSNELHFLQDVLPEVAICSVGNSGSYQHPRRQPYDSLYSLRAFIFQTARGYSGALSYAEPPIGYGILANGHIKVVYSGSATYAIHTPTSGQFNFTIDN